MNFVFKSIKIHRIFEAGIMIKAFVGIFETLGGILMAVSGQKLIDNIVVFLIRQEILDDPNDIIAGYFSGLSENFSLSTQIFAVAYLLFHGIINVFLAAALLRGKMWAYPLAIWLFSSFMVYQAYRYFHTFSGILLILIIFDVFVVSVIWLEFRRKKRRLIEAA